MYLHKQIKDTGKKPKQKIYMKSNQLLDLNSFKFKDSSQNKGYFHLKEIWLNQEMTMNNYNKSTI